MNCDVYCLRHESGMKRREPSEWQRFVSRVFFIPMVFASFSIAGAVNIPQDPCKIILKRLGMQTEGEVTNNSSSGDGIYDARATRAMEDVASDTGSARNLDRNIFEWYAQILPQRMDGVHIIDWGAGVGRFVPFFQRRGVLSVTVIEPSPESLEILRRQFGDARDVNVLEGGLGMTVRRLTSENSTYHVCNFVVNCVESLPSAFHSLAQTIRPQERLFLVTNVFAPKHIVESIPDSRAQSGVQIQMNDFEVPEGRLPVPRVFRNEIIHTGQILYDSVHTLVEYAQLWKTQRNEWEIVNARLMLPDGFRHQILSDEDFGDYRFSVLALELKRL